MRVLAFATVLSGLVGSVSVSTLCNEFAQPFSERVVQRKTKTFVVKTDGSATSNVQEVQQVSLWSHQVLDVDIKGAKVTGGTFKIEFCTFDIRLPGNVDYAPLPGEGSDHSLILVSTPSRNVTKDWENFGVYPGFPIRISTDINQNLNKDFHTYRLYFSACPPELCGSVTVKLDREYTGPVIAGNPGSAWGCSWNLPGSKLNYNANEEEVKSVFESVLGQGKVHSVKKIPISTISSGKEGYRFRVILAKGVNGVHARINSQELRGENLQPEVLEPSLGAVLGESFSVEKQGWSGTFRLVHKGIKTDPILPSALSSDIAEKLRKLPSIGPDVSITKSSDGWSWQITFRDSVGDVPSLEYDITDLLPVGGQIVISTPTPGQAVLEGEFELISKTTSKSVLVPASASEFNMRNLIKNDLGLGDVTVRRVGPTKSNGFEWFIEFWDLCGDTFDFSVVNRFYTPVCNVSLEMGSQTNDLLLGNDAKLLVENRVVLALGKFESNTVIWEEAGKLPQGLPSPTTMSDTSGTTYFDFPLARSDRGRYVFQAKSASGGAVIHTHIVYIDAAPPESSPGPDVEVSYPTSQISLNGKSSIAFFGSSIVSYRWTLTSKPANASNSAGFITNSNMAETLASSLNVPGRFKFALEVMDSLGLRGCSSKSVNVLFKPSILKPLSDKAAIPGTVVEFRCDASGSIPLSYQWFFQSKSVGTDPVQLDNKETSASLLLNDVSETDQGKYWCVVKNSVGSVQSNQVYLNVYDKIAIAVHPQSNLIAPGKPSTLTCEATGSFPIKATWQMLTATDRWINVTSNIATTGTENIPFEFVYKIPSVSENNQGEYRCMLENIAGSAPSNAAFLEVLDPPSNVVATVSPKEILSNGANTGTNFTLNCEATGASLVYSWERNGIFFRSGKTASIGLVSGPSEGGDFRCVVENEAGSAKSDVLNININTAPIIIEHPKPVVVDPGQSVSFSVTATGLQPMEYYWKKDGKILPGIPKANSTLYFASAFESESGLYSVLVSNALGTADSSLALLDIRDPPVVYEPSEVVLIERDPGQSVQLTCRASSSEKVSFLWKVRASPQQNFTRVVYGKEKAVGNSTTLRLDSLSENEQGEYVCVASNRLGSDQSKVFKVAVADLPFIVKHPDDIFADPGQSVSFQVDAGGAQPLTYSWRKNGVPIQSLSSNTLVIVNAQIEDEALYDVEDPGNAFVLSATFGGAPPMTYQWRRKSREASSWTEAKVVFEATTKLFSEKSDYAISSSSEEDDAEYLFFVRNKLGNDTSTIASVKINNPPVILTETSTYTVDPGDEITLDCKVVADPAVTGVVWTFRPVGDANSDRVLPGQTSFVLSLNDISQENEGTYKCLATNSAGSAAKIIAEVDVRDPPKIVLMKPVNKGGVLQLDPKQRVIFDAVVQGLNPFIYEWSLNGNILQTRDSSQLIWDAVEEGYIKLKVKNALGEDSAVVQIRLNTPAKVQAFDIVPENGRILFQGSAEFSCLANGTQPITFTWEKDGLDLNITESGELGQRYRIIHTKGSNKASLQILNADRNSKGNYQCRVLNSANPVGDVSESRSVTIVLKPEIKPGSPDDKLQFPNVDTNFTCELSTGTPPYRVEWFYKPSLDDPSPKVSLWNASSSSKYAGARLQNAEDPFALTIFNSKKEDQGLYACEVCNEAGCSQSRWSSFGVYDSPRVIEQSPPVKYPNITANPGDRVEFSVVATGAMPLGFMWARVDPRDASNFIPLTIDGTRLFLHPENCDSANIPCKLVFTGVQISDEGSYRCIVSNVLGTSTSVDVSLKINRPPSLGVATSWPDTLITACPGSAFRQEVVVGGTRPVDVAWYFVDASSKTNEIFDHRIASSKLTNDTSKAILDIKTPSLKDEGYYAFTASNMAGLYRSNIARLEFDEGPSAAADADGLSPRHPVVLPNVFTRLYATASVNAVAFMWRLTSSPQRSNSSLPIQIVTPASAVTDVIGLNTPGAYTFELVVTGSNGCTSLDTVTVNVHLPPVAVVPDALIALPLTTSAQLDGSLSYDADEFGSISAYEWSVVSFDDDESDIGNVRLSSSKTAVTSLENLQIGKYKIRLTVTDNDGATSSTTALIYVVEMLILSPTLPLPAPFVVGNCFEHDIAAVINGPLPNGSNTWVEISLVQGASATRVIDAGVLSKFDLVGSSETERIQSISSRWTVPHDLQPKNWNLQIILHRQNTAIARSVELSIVLPYRFVETSEWSSCDCHLQTRSRAFKCVGYGVDTLSGSNFCSWIEIEHDLSLCEKLSTPPQRSEHCLNDCESEYFWDVGPWSDLPLVIEERDFCSTMGCDAARTRSVVCRGKTSGVAADSLCNAVIKPDSIQRCIQTECSNRVWNLALSEKEAISSIEYDCIPVRRIFDNSTVRGFCRDRKSGFMFGPSKMGQMCGLDELSGVDVAQNYCPYVWAVGEWSCNRNSNRAKRSTNCMNSATNEVVSPTLCTKYQKAPNFEESCVQSPNSAPMKYRWKVGQWGNCSNVNCESSDSEATSFKSRAVRCVNQHAETTDDDKCEISSPKPQVVEECHKACPNACDGKCGANGYCSPNIGSCVCFKGWTGESCTKPIDSTADSCSGKLDSNNECCPHAGMIDRHGRCCDSERSILDAKGLCCNGKLDACGVCNGKSQYIDVRGSCCPSVLDAGGECCISGVIDRCGVCDGTGLSCAVEIWVSGTLTLQEGVPSNIENIRETFLRSTSHLQGTGMTLRGFRSSDIVGNRMLEVIAEEKISSTSSFEAHVTLLSNDAVMESMMLTDSIWRNGAISQIKAVQSTARGVCGNGICEVQEQCLLSFDFGESASESSCCPFDCMVPNPVKSCLNNCNGNGKCFTSEGECDCFEGYSGASCDLCSVNALSIGGKCVLKSSIPIETGTITPTHSPTTTSPTRLPTNYPTPGNETVLTTFIENDVYWPGILLGLILAVLLTICCSRYHIQRLKDNNPSSQKYIVADAVKNVTKEDPEWDISSDMKPCGWVWKKSRNGFDGKQVWQQWYLVKNGRFLFYMSSFDPATMRTKPSDKEPSIERGCIDLDRVERVVIAGKKLSKDGSETWWRFDTLMLANDGTEESVDILDYPVVHRRDSVTKTGEVYEWMCETRHEMELWTNAISKHAKTASVESRVGTEFNGRSNKDFSKPPLAERRISIDLTSSESQSVDSKSASSTSFPDSVAGNIGSENLIVGSFSGAVGYRVSGEGWVRHVEQNRTVYAVLFPELDQFSVFESMCPAKDGAHHYTGKVLEIELGKVTEVAVEKGSNKFTLRYWTGRTPCEFQFVVSSRAKKVWLKSLEQHMHFRHGVDIIAKESTEAQLPTKDRALSPEVVQMETASPTTPELDENEPINESLSSLKLRRVSSTASMPLKRGLARKGGSSNELPVMPPLPRVPPRPSSVASGMSTGSSSSLSFRKEKSALKRKDSQDLPSLNRVMSSSSLMLRARSDSASSFHTAHSEADSLDVSEHPLSGSVLPRRSSLSSVLDSSSVLQPRRKLSAWSQSSENNSDFEVV